MDSKFYTSHCELYRQDCKHDSRPCLNSIRYYEDVCLLDQKFVLDEKDGKKVQVCKCLLLGLRGGLLLNILL